MTGGTTLLARPLDHRLPLQGEAATLPDGPQPVYHQRGDARRAPPAPGDRPCFRLDGRQLPVGVKAIWRDYSRQSGAVLMERSDGNGSAARRDHELALWLKVGADPIAVQQALRDSPGAPESLEVARPASLRRFARDLRPQLRDHLRLQAVGQGLGLFGVAASLSAQLLARRREFGLLLHLGLTRAMLRRLVLAETLLQALAGAAMGLLVGLAISAVLVFRPTRRVSTGAWTGPSPAGASRRCWWPACSPPAPAAGGACAARRQRRGCAPCGRTGDDWTAPAAGAVSSSRR